MNVKNTQQKTFDFYNNNKILLLIIKTKIFKIKINKIKTFKIKIFKINQTQYKTQIYPRVNGSHLIHMMLQTFKEI